MPEMLKKLYSENVRHMLLKADSAESPNRITCSKLCNKQGRKTTLHRHTRGKKIVALKGLL